MKPILVVIHSPTWFIEMFRVARLLQSSPEYEPLIFWAACHHLLAREQSVCREAGFRCLDIEGNPLGLDEKGGVIETSQTIQANLAGMKQYVRLRYKHLPRSVQEPVRRIVNCMIDQARKACKAWPVMAFIRTLAQIKEFRHRYRFVLNLIERHQPAALVLAGDNVGYDTSVFIKAAHEKGSPVLLVPSTMSNGLEEAEVYFHAPDYWMDGGINKLAGSLFPHWVWEHRGRKILRMPGARVLAMEWLGLASPLPWIFCSGYADAIAAESEAMVDYYTTAGLPREKLTITGSLVDDVLARAAVDRVANRAALYKELCLPLDRPLLLSALPPDSLYMTGGRPECDFHTYPDLVEYWVKALSATKGWNVIIALHPSVPYEAMSYIEDWGVKITQRPTAEVIPLSDLYVASVSSTIRWAIASGIPVINYDIYRYHYTDFMQVKGVLYVEEQDEFRDLLSKITAIDQQYNKKIAAAQSRESAHWGCLDGRSGQRLLQLLGDLIARYQ